VQEFSRAEKFRENGVKISVGALPGTKFLLVEKLCITCERRDTPLFPFAHFSLAPDAPMGDNPALSHSGGTWASNSRRTASGATGAKHGVPARASFPKPEEKRSRACFPQLIHICGNSMGFSFLYS